MKNLIFLLILAYLPVKGNAQTFPELVIGYEEYCNTIVEEIVQQTGTIRYIRQEVDGFDAYGTPVKMQIAAAVDTLWDELIIPEYKSDIDTNDYRLLKISTSNHNSVGLEYILAKHLLPYIDGNIGFEIVMEKEIKRDVYCHMKLRRIVPFSEHFWNWCKEQFYSDNSNPNSIGRTQKGD